MSKFFTALCAALFLGAVVGCDAGSSSDPAPAAPAEPAAESTDEGGETASTEEGSGESAEGSGTAE
ncbi:MAG: hypothetical protein AAGF31_02045 [Planctomycetota bacterium]